MESLENIEEIREAIHYGVREGFKPLEELLSKIAVSNYIILLLSRTIKFGKEDKPPEYIEEQLKRIGDNPNLLFSKIILAEGYDKSEKFHFKLSETELVYTHDRFTLHLMGYLDKDYVGKFKFYRKFNSEEWYPEF